MELELREINVTLSKYQKKKICKAFQNREKILLRLKNDALTGNDTLLVPSKSLERMKDYYHNLRDTVDLKTFKEMLKNDTHLDNSTTDKCYENYCIIFSPTVVERLEEKRKNGEVMEIFLDYSLITDLTIDSVTRNIGKLFECGADCH